MGDGSLAVVDQLNNEVRLIAPGGDGSLGPGSVITTIVGNGTPGFKDAPGTTALLLGPTDVAVNGGNLLIADRGNQRVRLATPGGTGCVALTCNTSADCDDHDPCTLDSCAPNHLCTHAVLPPDQCTPMCSAEPSGCIAGGGPAKTDCLAELLVKGLSGAVKRSAPVVRCHDGDGSCDFDQTQGLCTFRIAWCFNEPGCNATGVTKVMAQGAASDAILNTVAKLASSKRAGRADVFDAPLQNSGDCTELMAMPVGLRKNGRKPGKAQLKLVAVGTNKRLRDVDKIRLVCLP
jgi:NHL repeat-containing protein